MKKNRNFFLLLQGLMTSTMGAHLFNMIGVLWLVETVNSASIVGFLMLAYGLSIAVFTPLGGVLADRLSRLKILVVTDLVSGLAILGLTGLFFLSDTLTPLIIGLFIAQIILGACAGFFMPTVFAFLPDILPSRELAKGNALINITSSVTQVLGKGLTGILFVSVGTPILLLITGICFLLSALTELFIRPQESSQYKDPETTENIIMGTGNIINSIIGNMAEGINYILANNGITRAFLLQIGLIWCLSTLMVNTPFLVQHHFFQSSAWYGYLLASLSFGFIAGSFYASQFNQLTSIKRRTYLLKCALLAVPLLSISLNFTHNAYLALPLFFLQGFVQSIACITIITQTQVTTPKKLCGRTISVFTMIGTIISAISSLMTGLLIDVMDKNVLLVQWLIGTVGCLLIYPLMTSKDLFLFLTYSSEPTLPFDDEEY